MATDQTALDLPTPEVAPTVDLRELIGLVAKRHGVMLTKGDPAFILVTLLEEVSRTHQGHQAAALERALDAITATTLEQKEAARVIAERIVNEGGAHLARRIEAAGAGLVPAITAAVTEQLASKTAELENATTQARKAKGAALAAAVVAIFAFIGSAGFYIGGLAS